MGKGRLALALGKAASICLGVQGGERTLFSHCSERLLVLQGGWACRGEALLEVAEAFLFWELIGGRGMAEMAEAAAALGD